jgi:energy-coupling factor transporter ATP-binding protein EcfA2
LEVLEWSTREVTIRLPFAAPRGISAALAHSIVKVLSNNQGLLLHAACLIRDEKAYLFLGRSGAGKTTIARHASGFEYVHDDNVAVRRRHGRWWAYGVPTLDNSGRPGLNVAAMIGGLYLIEKSGWLRKRALRRVAALRAMPGHVIMPVNDPLTRKNVFDTLLSLLAEVDIWRLQFRRDSDVGTVIRAKQ